MTWRLSFLIFMVPATLLLVGSAPAPAPDRLLRDGYAAYSRGDLHLAVSLYERAAERTTDPALVAFDLAAIQYRLALEKADARLMAEAEQNYRCCLEPSNPQRAAALYGLGTCLLARGQDVNALTEALDLFAKCLGDKTLPAELVADVRYNQEKARLALFQFQAAPASSGDKPPDSGRDAQPPSQAHLPEDQPAEPGERRLGNVKARGDRKPVKGEDGKNAQESNEHPLPGKGTLPPIPDNDEATPLSPREADAHLEQAASRIRAERQQALRGKAAKAPPAGVRDW